MQLKKDETVWMPIGRSDLMCVLKRNSPPPKTLEQFLGNQAAILQRLVDEADEADLREEQSRLVENLPYEVRMILPPEPLTNKTFSVHALMTELLPQADAGHPIREWITSARDAMNSPQTPMEDPETALELATELNLGTYLEALLY